MIKQISNSLHYDSICCSQQSGHSHKVSVLIVIVRSACVGECTRRRDCTPMHHPFALTPASPNQRPFCIHKLPPTVIPQQPHHAFPNPHHPFSQHRPPPLHPPHLHHNLQSRLPPPPARRAHRPQRTPCPHHLAALKVPPQGLANRLHFLRRQFYVQEDRRPAQRPVPIQGPRCRTLAKSPLDVRTRDR